MRFKDLGGVFSFFWLVRVIVMSIHEQPFNGPMLRNWLGFGSHLSSFCEGVFLISDMGVSKNSGTPKWMVYKGKPY